MKVGTAIGVLALVTACTPTDQYGAVQSQKYTGNAVFTLREEWGVPETRTRLVTGGRFYQFRKPDTDCRIAVWANDLDIIYRVAVSGPETCAAGS